MLLLAVAAYFTRDFWLPWPGKWLVQAESPEKAEAIVVLAGDFSGNRILKAAGLAREQYAPLVLVSGPYEVYGRNEASLAIDLAVSKGFPAAWFRAVIHRSDSTVDEANAMRRVLRDSHYRKVLLVTSDFHTRRAGRIFRRTMPEIEFHMIAARAQDFAPETWWKTRPGRKVVLQEWTKTLADWLGI